MKIKIVCCCRLFPSWSGQGLISTMVKTRLLAGLSGVRILVARIFSLIHNVQLGFGAQSASYKVDICVLFQEHS
jgi:hypothetical protein